MKKSLCLVYVLMGFICSNGQEVVNFKKLAESPSPQIPAATNTLGMKKTTQPAPVAAGVSIQESVPSQNQYKALETTPAANVAFTGVIGTDGIIPLNPGVAANDSFIVEVTNQQYSIYNKKGTNLMTLSQSTFYGIASSSTGVFDPKILYETKLNRWLISTGLKGYGVTLAVSLTDNPTGNWYIYHTTGIDSSIGFNDYPCMGYDDSLIVISCNDFTNYYSKTAQPDYAYNSFFVINKLNALSGTLKYSEVIDTNKFGLYPAQNFDGTDTLWNVGYMESYEGTAYYYVSYFTGGTHPVYHAAKTYSYAIGGNYNLNDFVPQKGTSADIYTGDSRVEPTPSVRSGQLLFCHEMSGPGSGTPTYNYVQWLQIKPDNGSLIQQGQINDATGYTTYFFPSITSDNSGDIMLGYNVTSDTNYISAAYSYHRSTDVAGYMSPNYIYTKGVSPYDVTLGAINRWGDNNMIAYDVSQNGFVGVFEVSDDTDAAGQVIWSTNTYGDSRGAIFEYAPGGVVTAPPVTCATPTGLETIDITANSAVLIWPNNTSAVNYQCYYNYDGDAPGLYNGTVHKGSVNDSMILQNLPSVEQFVWSVKAVCSSDTSALASTNTFTTLNTPCGEPTMEISVAATTASVNLGKTAITATIEDLVYSPYAAISWDTVAATKIKKLTACTEYYVYDYITCENNTYWFNQPTTFTTACTRADEVTASVQDIDGISFNVYPNPAADYTMIDFNPGAIGATLKLMDVSGRQVADDIKLTSTPQRLPLSFLPAGVYLLSIENDNERAVKLLVKAE